jgi:folylpolyglutamate synthase/dihydropteroate synthase
MARPELDPGVSRVSRVLARLGNPERSFACVHVAGTNGKGSVCALVEAALRASIHQILRSILKWSSNCQSRSEFCRCN